MAHIIPTGSGGLDVLDNVAMLCKSAHDVLDARVSWKQAQPRVLNLYKWSTLAAAGCVWPGCCDMKKRDGLCMLHHSVLHATGVVPGRTTEIRKLFAAYLGRDLYPPGQNDITKRKDG